MPRRGSVLARFLKLTVRNDSGATMVEYALMLALIAVVSLASVGWVGHHVRSVFNEVKDAIEHLVDN